MSIMFVFPPKVDPSVRRSKLQTQYVFLSPGCVGVGREMVSRGVRI